MKGMMKRRNGTKEIIKIERNKRSDENKMKNKADNKKWRWMDETDDERRTKDDGWNEMKWTVMKGMKRMVMKGTWWREQNE